MLIDRVAALLSDGGDLASSYAEHNEFQEAVDLVASDLAGRRTEVDDQTWSLLLRLASEMDVLGDLGDETDSGLQP